MYKTKRNPNKTERKQIWLTTSIHKVVNDLQVHPKYYIHNISNTSSDPKKKLFTLSADDFGDVFGAGHWYAFGHVLGFLRTNLLESNGGQGVDEAAEVGGTDGFGDGGEGLGETEHGQLEGQLVCPVVADAGAGGRRGARPGGGLQVREQTRRHLRRDQST